MTPNLLDQTEEDQIKIDESKNYLEELVGPGKKFATAEDMAKGKYLADEVIKVKDHRYDVLLEDYKKVRDENIAGPKLQELIDKNDALLQQLTTRQNTPSSNEDNKAAYDPKQVESLVSSTYQRMKQTEEEERNFNLVSNKLKEHLGTNYKNVLKEQADALGLTDDDVNSMARRNPNLFIKTFDLNVQRNNQSFQTPPRSDMRSDNFAPRSPEKRNWAYYLDLKKKNPDAWDKATRIQMDKDALALGKTFYD